MLHVDLFTIYLAMTAAGLAVSLVWLVVARTFPKLYAARYWFGATLAAGVGSTLSVWRGAADPLLPIVLGNGLILLGSGLGWAGVRELSRKSTPWLIILGITACAVAALVITTVAYDSMELRIVILSAAQSVLIGWAVVDILDRRSGGRTLGTLMAASACGVLLLLNAARSILAVLTVTGDLPFMTSSPLQGGLIFLLAMFGALVCQFGFLLMTMDRLQMEMAQLAGMDDLTGIANRRRFLATCEQECIRSIRSGHPFSVLVIDVDQFKAINDDHGHAAGDEFLKLLARTARSHLRGQDLLARLGGDEFSVLMPETSGENAAKSANRLVTAISGIALSRDGATVGSTISIGVAQWSPATGTDALALLELADRALYLTKKGGRNGVTLAQNVPKQVEEPLAA
jgi:diguanylate cyclase (GGDEF)-like protein